MSGLIARLVLFTLLITGVLCAYRGKRIGRLSELQHLVSGEVFAVDSRTIHIVGFIYDGIGPDAYFYAGATTKPSNRGFIIPDENGSKRILGAYRNQDITLTLPDGKTLKDINWISIWCRDFEIDFGNILIPDFLDYPRPQKIQAFTTNAHDVASEKIVVVDAQTFLIPNFSYDGSAPDAHFWVGKGNNPSPTGTIVPDENGSKEPLNSYSSKTIVITLPGDLTVFDIDFISIWCKMHNADFGHVTLPTSLNVPPSLKMLGVAPQSKLNCEVLRDDLAFEVRWAVAGESIVMQLVGRVENGEYMAFGLSGNTNRSVMTGGDVIVTWLDQASGKGAAVDYHLGAKSQCQGGQGACPDDKTTGGLNNVRLLNAALINDFTMLTFQRPLINKDLDEDMQILTNELQAVIWAVGPVNSQGDASYHSMRQQGDKLIDFGRTPSWKCPLPEDGAAARGGGSSRSNAQATPRPAPPPVNPWFIPEIPCYEPEDGVFYAQIGPSGGRNGYDAITGHVGWGISWYINGLLIPEINLVRGKTYTFVVEGGFNTENTARYHPFYITDDAAGGYEFKTPAERSKVRVFAGVARDRHDTVVPTAFGRLCEWTQDPNQPANAFDSFGAYQRSLNLECQEGQPGILQWTPDENTPNTVFYQCYTHRYLGWKMNIVDQCNSGIPDAGSAGARSDYDVDDYYYDYNDPSDDAIHGGSIRQETRIEPNHNDFEINRYHSNSDKKTSLIKDELSNMANFPHGFPAQGFDNFNFQSSNTRFTNKYPGHLKPRSKPKLPLGVPGYTFPTLPTFKESVSPVNASAFAQLGEHIRDVPMGFLPDNLSKIAVSQNINKPISSTGHDDYQISTHQYSTTSTTTTTTQSTIRPNKPQTVYRRPKPKPTHIYFQLTTPKPTRAYTTDRSTTKQNRLTTPPRVTRKKIHHLNRPTPPTPPTPKRIVTKPNKPNPVIVEAISYNVPEEKNIRFHEKIPTTKTTSVLQPLFISTDATSTIEENNQRFYSNNQDNHNTHKMENSHQQEYIDNKNNIGEGYYSSMNTIPPRSNYPTKYSSSSNPSATYNFAENFGFDPQSVVYESDFRPIRENEQNVLAFHVSSTDNKPSHRVWSPDQLNQMRFNHPVKSPLRFFHRHITLPNTQLNNPSNAESIKSMMKERGTPYPTHYGASLTDGIHFNTEESNVEFQENNPETSNNQTPHNLRQSNFNNPITGLTNAISNLFSVKNIPMPIKRIINTFQGNNNRNRYPNRESVNRKGLGDTSINTVQKKGTINVISHVALPEDHVVLVPQAMDSTHMMPLINIYHTNNKKMPNLLANNPNIVLEKNQSNKLESIKSDLPESSEENISIIESIQSSNLERSKELIDQNTGTQTEIEPKSNDKLSVIVETSFKTGEESSEVILQNQFDDHTPSNLIIYEPLSINSPSNKIVNLYKGKEYLENITSIPDLKIDEDSFVRSKTNQTHMTILKDVWSTLVHTDSDRPSKTQTKYT